MGAVWSCCCSRRHPVQEAALGRVSRCSGACCLLTDPRSCTLNGGD